MMEQEVTRQPASGSRLMRNLDARLKWFAAMTLIVAMVSVPAASTNALALYAALVLSLWVCAAIPVCRVVKRLSVLLPFVALTAISAFLHRATSEGSMVVLAKSLLCVLTVTMLVETTPLPALLGSLRSFRVPELLVSLLGFMIRFLEVLQDETRTMHRAYLSRGGQTKNLRHAGQLGSLLASLILRTYHRSDRLHAAMLSRNFSGTLPAFRPRPLTVWQVTPLAFLLLGIVALGVLAF